MGVHVTHNHPFPTARLGTISSPSQQSIQTNSPISSLLSLTRISFLKHHNGLPNSLQGCPLAIGSPIGGAGCSAAHHCCCWPHLDSSSSPRCCWPCSAADSRHEDDRLCWIEGRRLWCVLIRMLFFLLIFLPSDVASWSLVCFTRR